MGHVCWPTRLAISSDLRAYFIVSLSFYDFLKALSSGRKLIHCGASKGFNFFTELYVRCIGRVNWGTWKCISWNLTFTRNVQDFWVVLRHSKAEAQYAGGILDKSLVVRSGTSGLWSVSRVNLSPRTYSSRRSRAQVEASTSFSMTA